MARPVSRMSVNRQDSNIIVKSIDQSLNSCESMVQSESSPESRVQVLQIPLILCMLCSVAFVLYAVFHSGMEKWLYCQLPELNYKSNQINFYCYLCSEHFAVTDPPSILDPNLSDVAKFLSVYLENDENFHKFGAQLVSTQLINVTIIKQKKVELQKKCLELIELWIRNVNGPKWQHLAQAASKSKLEGLATVLSEELQLNGQKELQESVDETRGGKYKVASIINLYVY